MSQFATPLVSECDAAVMSAKVHSELIVNIALHFFYLVGGAQVALAYQECELSVVDF
ncbi:hypothetical protein D3C84_948350 [compost metagenome]